MTRSIPTHNTAIIMWARAPLRPTQWRARLSINIRRQHAGALHDGVAKGERGVRACIGAILDQQLALLNAVDDQQYTFHSPLLQSSIGQHTRHSLDHLRKPLEAWLRNGAAEMIRYDLRERKTDVEQRREAAVAQVAAIRRHLDTLDEATLSSPVSAAFMLSGDGHEFAFDSTLSRELAFAVHHCIHHNALAKILLRHHFPSVIIPDAYGMAPSTLNFNLTHPAESS